VRRVVTDGVAWSVCRSVTAVSPAKTAEPIEMSFGMWTRVDRGNHYYMWVHIDATWRIRLNRPRAAAMRRPFCQTTLTTCFHHHLLLRQKAAHKH